EPLMARLGQILGSGAPPQADVARRIRVQTVGARRLHVPHFQALGSALLRRQRMQLVYRGRGRDETSQREVSPQRLIHYRDNWYLDAWCHLRESLRSFSMDAIEQLRVMEEPALEVSQDVIDATMGTGYGIFSGAQTIWGSATASR
ncbi:MAG: helix-turn-helix transcriptional regulator, partial [Burkholderiales bacterium]